MSDENANEKEYPGNWRIATDFDPNAHLMNLKGKDYLSVQNRMIWFVRDQRDFIAKGLATGSYLIRTELVEQDREAGFAQFKTTVRDVLGNEATMYGSETKADFPDYAEKASTKSLGRALAMLGYGTQFAPEMDEGERVVDAPVEHKAESSTPAPASAFVAKPPKLAAPDQPEFWRFLQDVDFRRACGTANISTVDAVETFVRETTKKHDLATVTKADRNPCMMAANQRAEQINLRRLTNSGTRPN